MLGKLNRSGNEGYYERIETKRKRRSGVGTVEKKNHDDQWQCRQLLETFLFFDSKCIVFVGIQPRIPVKGERWIYVYSF